MMAKKSGFTITKWMGPQIAKKLDNASKKAIDETTMACVTKAKQRSPRDTTLLQGSIEMRPAVGEGKDIKGEWGAFNNLYALFVELGTDPHFPPVEMLKPWARRKLGDENAAWPVAINISKHGTKPHPFLRPVADEEYPKLKGRIKKHYVS
jgi:hypothetical protein